MTIADLLLAIIGIIIGASVSIFLGWYFYVRQREERRDIIEEQKIRELEQSYENEMNEIKQEYERQIRLLDEQECSPAYREKIHSDRIRKVFDEKYNKVIEGEIELDILEASAVWSTMFKEKNTIFLRATSYIDPDVWDNEFMRKYSGQQRRLVDYLKRLKTSYTEEYESAVLRIKNSIQEVVDWPNNYDTNFERIFIIRSQQLIDSQKLRRIAEIISDQSYYMSVRIVYEKKVGIENLRDFGILVSKEGDMLTYRLKLVSEGLYGGEISANIERFRQAVNRYKILRSQSKEVAGESPVNLVLDVINKASDNEIDEEILSETKSELPVHKCRDCFLKTEIAMGLLSEDEWNCLTQKISGLAERINYARVAGIDWQTLSDERRLWFEMIRDENTTALDYIRQRDPDKIIEIGCGPGRLVSQIVKISDFNPKEIIGIDGDPEMIKLAYARFPDNIYPNVNVFQVHVKDRLPYGEDAFDFCINAMNIVGWQEKEIDWIKEMLRCSKTIFFTLYKEGKEQEREAMYRRRGHQAGKHGVMIDEETGQIQLNDCATNPGVLSKSYSRQEVEHICYGVASAFQPQYRIEISIDDTTNELLYLIFITKTKLQN